MSTYVVNVNDPLTPTNLQDALQGAEELRAIKAKLNTLVPGGSSNVLNSGVRQTVLQGPLVAGIPTIVGTTAGLNADFKAAALAVYLAFAGGFNNAGAVDFIEIVGIDTVNYWTALPASNTSFLGVTRTGVGVLVPYQTLAPCQYEYTYDRSRQAVLQFTGPAGATTFIDDFGNTWTASGAAKIQTNYVKYGVGALGGAGATNALDGVADTIKSTNINTLGNGSWSLRAWTKPLNALPGAGAIGDVFGGVNVASGGVQFGIYNNAGVIKFGYFLSSDGATNNIANGVQGTTTPVLGTEYFVELTYDSLAGVYRMYVNGVQEASTASALRVCSIASLALGSNGSGGGFYKGYIDKPEFLPYCQHPAGTAYVVPAAAPDITVAGYASDWFDINQWLMKHPSIASIVAATDPTFALVNRVYIGEADTSAVACTAQRTYAYQGKYTAAWITPIPAAATTITKAHNLGTEKFKARIETLNLVAQVSFVAGDVCEEPQGINGAYSYTLTRRKQRNNLIFITGITSAMVMQRPDTGDVVALTAANWAYRVVAERAF